MNTMNPGRRPPYETGHIFTNSRTLLPEPQFQFAAILPPYSSWMEHTHKWVCKLRDDDAELQRELDEPGTEFVGRDPVPSGAGVREDDRLRDDAAAGVPA